MIRIGTRIPKIVKLNRVESFVQNEPNILLRLKLATAVNNDSAGILLLACAQTYIYVII